MPSRQPTTAEATTSRSRPSTFAAARGHYVDAAIAFVGIGLALALRLSLLEFKSIDYFNYTKVWYNAIKDGGFSAFGQGFSNYNLPYLYLLYGVVRLLPDLPGLIATKLPSISADFLSAGLVYLIVRQKSAASPIPVIAGLAVLFAPTVVLNSAFWGQADAVYNCALLACLYLLLRRRSAAAMIMFGIALAFKAQAIFLAPLLLGLLLRKEIPWRMVLLIPAVYVAALVPAWIAGRPLVDLLLIYAAQAGQYQQLTMHAPSSLAWLPDAGTYFPYFYLATLVLAAAVALGWTTAIWKSPSKLTPGLLIELALISVILVPFILPKMHERYFYAADVLSVIFVFFVPALYFVPIAMVTISFFAYQPTLFGAEPIPMGALALGVLILLVVLLRHVMELLYPAAEPGQQSPLQ